jgi:sporulation protein YlmC with PRC-barrel domain
MTMTMTMTTLESPLQLILASRVNGTPVFDAAGERIGHVADLAVDKASGQVAYAILSFGGLLGMGEKHHPIPWSVLTYDVGKGGYGVALNKDQLTQAPSYHMEDLADIGATHTNLGEYWGPFI